VEKYAPSLDALTRIETGIPKLTCHAYCVDVCSSESALSVSATTTRH